MSDVLTGQERLDLFLQRIDDYITLKNAEPSEVPDEAHEADSMTFEEMNSLTQSECFAYGYALYQYCDNILHEMNKQAIVHTWCTNALNTCISRERDEFFTSSFNRIEIKVARLAVDNEFIHKIREWQTVAGARRDSLKNKEYLLKKKAECLIEKGKRL